jgi:cysteinyl-tRNA synthetase
LGGVLRVHDTASGRLVDLETREPGKVSMYVCGPTVHDVAHLGHGRHLLVFDVMRRYLAWRGLEVRYVSNVTDIEDKIIAKANARKIPAEQVVAENEAAWWSLVERLGCRRPDEAPHATAYVEQMVAYIAELIDRGRAYVTDDGVYFSVEALEGYGLLARQSLESMRAGGGDREIVGEEGKRHPFDFALWKKAKAGEPAWPSPWEAGRPGWHIECTVMALDLLGEGFDLHGGGLDLAFPHHENERAQAVGGGRRFATHWIHHGMVLAAGGEEMHRSAGNFITLADLLDEHDARAYRLLVLQSHYRGPMEVNAENLGASTQALERFDNFARRVAELPKVPADESVLDAFRREMDEDFNSPPALAVVWDALRRANTALQGGDTERAAPLAAAVLELMGMLGVEPRAGDEVDAESAALASQRDEARAAKDWGRADALRAELEGLGWTVQDGPSGTRLTR